MTQEERENAIRCLKLWIKREPQIQTYKTCLEALEQQPCEVEAAKLQQAYNKGFEDCRNAVLDLVNADWKYEGLEVPINSISPVTPNPYLPDTNDGNMAEIPTGSDESEG